MVKKIVVIIGQTNIHTHFAPIIFFCSGLLRSVRNIEIFTQKDTITVGLITVKQNRKMPIFVYVKLSVVSPIARKIVGIKQ